MKGHISFPRRVSTVRELLDNREFLVNQQGQMSYTLDYNTARLTVDRWKIAGTGSATCVNGYDNIPGTYDTRCLHLHGGTTNVLVRQELAAVSLGMVTIGDGQYTGVAWVYADQTSEIEAQGTHVFRVTPDTWHMLCWPMPTGSTEFKLNFVTPGSYWLAMPRCISGRYTADTVPPFVPVSYSAELAGCKQWFLYMDETKWYEVTRPHGEWTRLDVFGSFIRAPTLIGTPRVFANDGIWHDMTVLSTDPWIDRCVFRFGGLDDLMTPGSSYLVNGITGVSCER